MLSPIKLVLLAGSAAFIGGAPVPEAARLSPAAVQLLDPTNLIRTACRGDAARAPTALRFATAEGVPTGGGKRTPLVEGLGQVHWPISTKVEAAQRYFDQGLALTYGFSYAEAEKSFREAARLDPSCAMCAWGVAYAIGPYVNMSSVKPDTVAEARTLTTRALSLAATPHERALIEALHTRYAPGGKEGNVHAKGFATGMLALADRFPADDMTVVLAAEAVMAAQPWDYWEAGARQPKGSASRAITLVERVLERSPQHPQANHLYIHLMEAAAQASKAEAAADRLLRLAPGSAHLVHMPSHLYYRVGRYRDAVDANVDAIAADERYAKLVGDDPQHYGYFRHHAHFIVSAAEQVGDRETALAMADKLEAASPVETIENAGFAQGRLATGAMARAQFLDPQAYLARPHPDKRLVYLRAIDHIMRAGAHARLGNGKAMEAELVEARTLRDSPRMAELLRGSRLGSTVLALGEQVARGRIAMGRGDTADAVRRFRAAAAIEAGFPYFEPPIWHQPVQQSLGAALLKAGDAAGARTAFMAALAQRPNNSWTLYGLAEAQKALGDESGRRGTLAALNRNWTGERALLDLARL